MMAEVVYILCAVLSTICTALLLRGYFRSHSPLLLLAGLCFGLLAVNNGILVADLIVFPDIDFGGALWRNIFGASAGSLLLFGLIWELT